MQQELKISVTLLKHRNDAKTILGATYPERIKPYKEIITGVMKANQVGPLQAVLKLSETDVYQQSEVAKLLFMAAAVEIVDPVQIFIAVCGNEYYEGEDFVKEVGQTVAILGFEKVKAKLLTQVEVSAIVLKYPELKSKNVTID